MELTHKQQRLLDYLKNRRAQDGSIPSLRRAAADLGVSHTAVAQLMAQLEKKQVIRRAGRYSRAIEFMPVKQPAPSPQHGRRAPIVGHITAGLPMYAQQQWDGSVVLDETLFGTTQLFCLRVQGDSMRGAGILDGDLVVCEPRQYAENGEIVAALVNQEEATVKRFFRTDKGIELHPENDAYQIIHYHLNEVLVQGAVVGVIRAPRLYRNRHERTRHQ
jgi:repressor LexA